MSRVVRPWVARVSQIVTRSRIETRSKAIHNQRDGTFKEEALMTGVALGDMGEATGAMAVETGDINGNGRIDLYVPDFTQSCLYINTGKGFFDNQTGALRPREGRR